MSLVGGRKTKGLVVEEGVTGAALVRGQDELEPRADTGAATIDGEVVDDY